MTIERTSDKIIISLATDFELEKVQQLIEHLRYWEVAFKSKATQADADQLAKEANQNWWQKNQHKYLPQNESSS